MVPAAEEDDHFGCFSTSETGPELSGGSCGTCSDGSRALISKQNVVGVVRNAGSESVNAFFQSIGVLVNALALIYIHSASHLDGLNLKEGNKPDDEVIGRKVESIKAERQCEF